VSDREVFGNMQWKASLFALAACGVCMGCGGDSTLMVKSNTRTAVTASAVKATTGGPISFTVTVKQQGADGKNAPTGAVTLSSGPLNVGTITLAAGTGTLKLSTLSSTELALGPNAVTANYSGDSYNNGSVSPSISVAVTATTTMSLYPAPDALEQGQVGYLIAAIGRTDATGVATGSVDFFAGSQSIGTIGIDSGGNAELPVASAALPLGDTTYSANYAGDELDTPSSGNATLTVVEPVSSPVDVLMHRNNVARTGVQAWETVLNPANVNVNNFGKLFALPVDGNVFAAPLFVGSLTMNDGKVHNVVYVATTNATVYAFDADGNNPPSGYLWKSSLLAQGERPLTTNDYNCPQPEPSAGIIGTPVIDRQRGALYLVALSKLVGSNTTQYFHRLHALSLGTGLEALNGPTVVTAQVSGTGVGSVNGILSFDPLIQNQRSALLEADGGVWIEWASHCTNPPYHGWTLVYNASDISEQIAANNTTPNATQGGIWMAGGGASEDSGGNVYNVSGNGTFDVNTGGDDYGDTVRRLMLSGNAITVSDWFTPSNQLYLDNGDQDEGTAGALLFDDPASGIAPHLLVTSNKAGRVFLLNTDNLGKYDTGHNGPDGLNGDIEDFAVGQQIYSDFGYFNGRLYIGADALPLGAYTFTPGTVTTAGTLPETPSYTTVEVFGGGVPGGTEPAFSANGVSNGIVWALNYQQTNVVLYAFDANTLAELWDSSQAPKDRDAATAPVSFTVPVIANGKVFVGSEGQVTVYGLLNK
jgi:hypothetical protein